jgi:segregation and condensation protein B
MENKTLNAQIEAILFWKGEPIKIKKLVEILETTEEIIQNSLNELENSLQNRGLVLIRKEDEVTLGTAPTVSPLIEKLTKEELIRDLGKAGLETLSIIIYKGPVSRAEIDYIRGVQSNFIIRNLSIRGLIEKVTNPKDQRSFLYKPTFDLLQYLGVTKIEDMPEFSSVKTELEKFEQTTKEDSEEADEVKKDIENEREIQNGALDDQSKNIEN